MYKKLKTDNDSQNQLIDATEKGFLESEKKISDLSLEKEKLNIGIEEREKILNGLKKEESHKKQNRPTKKS